MGTQRIMVKRSQNWVKSALVEFFNLGDFLYCGCRCNLLLAMATQFQEFIVLPSHKKISVVSMSCANPPTLEKLQENLNAWVNFLLVNFTSTLFRQVGIFPHDGNAIISKNCVAIVSKKLAVYSYFHDGSHFGSACPRRVGMCWRRVSRDHRLSYWLDFLVVI